LQPSFYMPTDLCVQYFDVTVIPPVVGGCMFEMPAGNCYEKELQPRSRG
jgi:hypothetical protein